jgi:hypothetical protein
MLHLKTNDLLVFFLGGGGYLRIIPCMFYMIDRRLNNCRFQLVLCVHMFFFFFVANAVVLSIVFRGRCVDKGSPHR